MSQTLHPAPMQEGWGFIDDHGKPMASEKFDQVGDFCDGLALVSLGSRKGFVDTKGKLVIPATYEDATYFSEGFAAVKVGGKWGFINKTGHLVIQATLSTDPFPFSDGYAQNGPDLADMTPGLKKDFFIDKMGRHIAPVGSISLVPYAEGFAWSEQFDGKHDPMWVVIDKSMKQVSSSLVLCNLPMKFSEGLAAIQPGRCREDTLTGFVDSKGELVIPAKFDFAGDFSSGLARAKVGSKWGFIDGAGNWKIPAQYPAAFDFHDGLAAVVVDGNVGFINPNGTLVIPPKFDLTKMRLLDSGFRGQLAEFAVLVPGNPKRVAVEYIDRNGDIAYGPVTVTQAIK